MVIDKFFNDLAKNRLFSMLIVAFGFFLGMRYNAYLTNILSVYLPIAEEGNLALRGFVLILITFAVVYGIVYLRKALKIK